MWRISDVKINFKHIKIFFIVQYDVFYREKCRGAIVRNVATQRLRLVLLRRCRETTEIAQFCVATQRLGAFLLRRCRESSELSDFVSRRNV